MAWCATLFQGVAVWAGLPATLFALMLLLGFRLNTRFTWILLLLGLAGLSTYGLSIACAGWATGTARLPGPTGLAPAAATFSPEQIWRINATWLTLSSLLIAACLAAVWGLLRRRVKQGQ